jgi:hypothetical protein
VGTEWDSELDVAMHALRIRKLGLAMTTKHSVAAELWNELVGEVTPVEVGAGEHTGLLEQCHMDWTRFWRVLADAAADPHMKSSSSSSPSSSFSSSSSSTSSSSSSPSSAPSLDTWTTTTMTQLRAASYDESTLQPCQEQWVSWLAKWRSHVDCNGGAEAMASVSPRCVTNDESIHHLLENDCVLFLIPIHCYCFLSSIKI